MTNILIVEDDISLNKGIVLALKQENYDFISSYDVTTALSAIRKKAIDIVILDVNLPDGSGYDVLKEFRKSSNNPVLILTANDLELDEVVGLELGADDYMTKPFSLMVLRARVTALLRRTRGKESGKFEIGDEFQFDFDQMNFLKWNQKITLSLTEQKLLRLLVENKGRTLTRNMLVDRIWTEEAEFVDENALSVTIRRLRSKLEDNPAAPNYIHTVYGIGYVWKEEV